MQQSARERQCIQHLGPFIERINLDRTKRNRAGTVITRQLRADGSEVLARASENGNAPRLGSARRQRPCAPLFDDATNLARLALNACSTELNWRWVGIMRNRVAAENLGVPDD